MSDIFISYAREDQPQAETMSHCLETQGWSVWWDRTIPAGRTFDEVIEEAINDARCVLVLWSERSVSSKWVRIEAQEGADRKILIPVLIEEVQIPLAFRRIQAANLIGWDGSDTASSFQQLIDDIAIILGPPPKKEEKHRKADEWAKPAAKEIARDGNFIAYDNGTVVDTSTSLMWAAKDNGRDVTWQEAKEYCESYRGGGYTDWRMPFQYELVGIYDESKKNRHGYRVTKLIDISACCPWASEISGSRAASYFFIWDGGRDWAPQSHSNDRRALPVRSGN